MKPALIDIDMTRDWRGVQDDPALGALLRDGWVVVYGWTRDVIVDDRAEGTHLMLLLAPPQPRTPGLDAAAQQSVRDVLEAAAGITARVQALVDATTANSAESLEVMQSARSDLDDSRGAIARAAERLAHAPGPMLGFAYGAAGFACAALAGWFLR